MSPEARSRAATPVSRRRGSLDRASIAAAATGLIEREGLARLTMRSLAADLDCGTMSLYGYVKNRDDLVTAVIEHLIAEVDVADTVAQSHADWQALLFDLLSSYRLLAERFPRSFELLALAPAEFQPVAQHLDGVLAALEAFGLSRAEAATALSVADSFATGHLLVRLRRDLHDGSGSASSTRRSAAAGSERDFADGLGVVIAGLSTTFTAATP